MWKLRKLCVVMTTVAPSLLYYLNRLLSTDVKHTKVAVSHRIDHTWMVIYECMEVIAKHKPIMPRGIRTSAAAVAMATKRFAQNKKKN